VDVERDAAEDDEESNEARRCSDEEGSEEDVLFVGRAKESSDDLRSGRAGLEGRSPTGGALTAQLEALDKLEALLDLLELDESKNSNIGELSVANSNELPITGLKMGSWSERIMLELPGVNSQGDGVERSPNISSNKEEREQSDSMESRRS